MYPFPEKCRQYYNLRLINRRCEWTLNESYRSKYLSHVFAGVSRRGGREGEPAVSCVGRRKQQHVRALHYQPQLVRRLGPLGRYPGQHQRPRQGRER